MDRDKNLFRGKVDAEKGANVFGSSRKGFGRKFKVRPRDIALADLII